MSLGIDNVVSISDIIAGAGVLRREFGITLMLTTDETISLDDRIVVLKNSDDGDAIFAEDTEPRKALDIYFQQTPYPKNLIIGRWNNASGGTPAILTGGEPSTLQILSNITGGSFNMNGEDYTGIGFIEADSYATCAGIIQTKLHAGTDLNLKTATVTYDAVAGAFVITTATLGVTATLTFASTTNPLVGTDIAEALGWSEHTYKSLQQGAAAETITAAIEACIAKNDSPYFIVLDETITDWATIHAVSVWCATRRYMFVAESLEAGVLTPAETASVFAQLFATTPPRTFGTWSATADYKGLSAAARLSSVNFSGSNTLITLNLKQLIGCVSDNITTTQKAELDRKNINYYVPLMSLGSPAADSYMPGTTFKKGVWVDVRYWLDWLVNAIQIEVFNLLYTSGKIPQTEAGITTIHHAIETVLIQGIRNGGIAQGQLSAALTADVQNTTGDANFDGYLTKGYLIYATPIADQSQTDRDLRKSPPFKIWIKGSGAINSIDISLTFEN